MIGLAGLELPFLSVYTSSASLLVEWRILGGGGGNLATKIKVTWKLAVLVQINEVCEQPLFAYLKTRQTVHTNVYVRIAIVQITEFTYIFELLIKS